jgi:hypothetical protein
MPGPVGRDAHAKIFFSDGSFSSSSGFAEVSQFVNACSGEPAGTRTQGRRLKRSKRQNYQWLDFATVSPIVL